MGPAVSYQGKDGQEKGGFLLPLQKDIQKSPREEISPAGRHLYRDHHPGRSDIEVWEYGFSKAVADLCPEGWKKPLGDEWEDILKIIICSWSETSYLQRGEIRSREEFRCQFNTQAASLSRRIWKEHKVEPKDLAPLKRIYLLKIGKENVISKIDPEQQEILDRLGLKLEV